jgi:hypothetical protein
MSNKITHNGIQLPDRAGLNILTFKIAITMKKEQNSNEPINPALRVGDVRYQLAISALEAIIDPIGHMRKQLKEDERLDGMYAIRIAERPEYYQEIARKALEEIANCT